MMKSSMSKSECQNIRSSKFGGFSKNNTNPRYRNFYQSNFTAGDKEQFYRYRDKTNNLDSQCKNVVSGKENIFIDIPNPQCDSLLYNKLDAQNVSQTFNYIFEKFKKGIFIKIENNELKTFLPFSNANFFNEWSHLMKYRNDIHIFGRKITRLTNLAENKNYQYKKNRTNGNPNLWYANNCLIRNEWPISEGESNDAIIKDLFENLCKERNVPDLEFFVNRRDFPILTKDGTEPYYHIWGKGKKLVSHWYKKYTPILSMSKTESYADITIPTHEDWARVKSVDEKNPSFFPKNCRDYRVGNMPDWDNKKSVAVFRGSSTGCGTTLITNPRLKIAFISELLRGGASKSYVSKIDSEIEKVGGNGKILMKNFSQNTTPKLLDAFITKWKFRPRKTVDSKYIHTIDFENMGLPPADKTKFLTPEQQAEYKYIVNIDGYVSAFRLSQELGLGSVILLVESDWKMWYSDYLVPMIHYVPVKKNLSNLLDQIIWCQNNDSECKRIAQNALKFKQKFLDRKGILDYLQNTLVKLKKNVGLYLYNTISPSEIIGNNEKNSLKNGLSKKVPEKGIILPTTSRSWGKLEAQRLIINKFDLDYKEEGTIFDNTKTWTDKDGIVHNRGSSCKIYKYCKNGILLEKRTFDKNKTREFVHEAFVGIKCINKILKYIPNFSYTYTLEVNNAKLLKENIKGITLQQYMTQNDFDINTFYRIITQIGMALSVAQEKCMFVHWDLMPWNVIIQNLDYETTVDYLIQGKVYRIKTDKIPIIIDYGKSHVVYNNIHYGFIEENLFSDNKKIDINSLLQKCILEIITKRRDFSYRNSRYINSLFYFITGEKKIKFHRMKSYLKKNTKFSNLIYNSNTYKSNMEIVQFLEAETKSYKIYRSNSYYSIMNTTNPTQVFNFSLAQNDSERVESFMDIYRGVTKCNLPEINSALLRLYTTVAFEKNLINVYVSMKQYLETKNINNKDLVDNLDYAHKATMQLIKNTYPISEELLLEEISSYNTNIQKPTPLVYTNKTFLNPHKILDKIKKTHESTQNILDIQNIITCIYFYAGNVTTSTAAKKLMVPIVTFKSQAFREYSANSKTLQFLSNIIFNQNMKQNLDTCKKLLPLKLIYEEILLELKK